MSTDPQPGNHEPPPLPARKGSSRGRETYNMISDTVVGVNFRWRDNVIQAVAILFFIAAGAAAGGWDGREQGSLKQGMLLGAVAGMIGGVLITGVCIMIYRGVRHLTGKHD